MFAKEEVNDACVVVLVLLVQKRRSDYKVNWKLGVWLGVEPLASSWTGGFVLFLTSD
jgi:hypothetical protein